MIQNCQRPHDFLGTIRTELIHTIALAPENDDKTPYVCRVLEQLLHGQDLTRSFQRPQILLLNEQIHHDIFVALDYWVRRQACDIRNIWLVSTSTLGLDQWYHDWLYLHGLENYGMRVLEVPWIAETFQTTLDAIKTRPDRQRFKSYFTTYGGTWGNDERDFIIAWLMDYRHLGHIDYFAGFGNDRQSQENYFESMTHFLDQTRVESLLSKLDHQFEHLGEPHKKFNFQDFQFQQDIIRSLAYEKFDFQGFQFQQDIRSFSQIVRETFNCQPWNCLSEKTLRPFLHLQMPLPLSGRNAVQNLENQGFVFLHDVIDYSYQDQGHLTDRFRGLEKNLINWSSQLSLDDLYDISLEHQDVYHHNFDLIASGELFSRIMSRFREQFDN